MKDVDRRRVQAVFLQITNTPEMRREETLEAALGDEPLLKQAVREMVETDQRAAAAGFLQIDDSEFTDARSRIGHFRISYLLGSGGMGTVYEAVQEPLERQVALKVVRTTLVSERAKLRFKREAEFLADLHHENIAQVYEAGTAETIDGEVTYFAMELVKGARTLTDYARATGLNTPQRLHLFGQVCKAVGYLHQRKLVHRDLKPGNILVSEDGQVKIVDFGIARSTDPGMYQNGHTATGELLGTLAYMSPEQCVGPAEDLDHRSDVYSLGIVLYELLCDQLPYDLKKEAIEEALRVIREAKPAAPGVVRRELRGDLEVIALKTLEKDPKYRYQSVHDLATDIGHVASGRQIMARPPTQLRQLLGFLRANRTKLLIVGIVAVLATALGYQWTVDPSQARLSVMAVDSTGDGIVGAAVYLRRIDPATRALADEELVGQTPLSISVDPGYFRIVVVLPEYGFAELIRDLRPADVVTVETTVHPETEVVGDMALLPAGTAIVGMDTNNEHFAERSVPVRGIWVDRYEVSNADYQRFRDATGGPMPILWGGEYREEWADLPVVGLTWYEARDYAEWCGKRLPTDIEWERAARGLDGNRYPWGEERPGDRDQANAHTGDRFAWGLVANEDGARDAYLNGVVPVDNLLEGHTDRTPEGLLHMYGNVSEWTESMLLAEVDGETVEDRLHRVVKGGHWGRSEDEVWHLGDYMDGPVDIRGLSGGFRCVRSAAPFD